MSSFSRSERTEAVDLTGYANAGSKTPKGVLVDALEGLLGMPVLLTIEIVLRLGAKAQVTAPIIKRVEVGVVHQNTCLSRNYFARKEKALATSRRAYRPLRTEASAGLLRTPRVTKKTGVFRRNEGHKTLGKRRPSVITTFTMERHGSALLMRMRGARVIRFAVQVKDRVLFADLRRVLRLGAQLGDELPRNGLVVAERFQFGVDLARVFLRFVLDLTASENAVDQCFEGGVGRVAHRTATPELEPRVLGSGAVVAGEKPQR